MTTRAATGRRGVTSSRLPLPSAVAAGAAAVLTAGLVTGIYASYAVDDPGALVRWSLPVAEVLRDLASSATIGLLALAVFIVPERRTTERRSLACKLAVGTALVWVVASVLVLLFTFADLAGNTVGGLGYWDEFRTFVWSLEVTRVIALNGAAALCVFLGALVARSRATMAWLALIGLAGLVLLALTGHSAGSASHETAVNALAVHLLGVGIWVGGLIGLAMLRPALDADLGVSVARYSKVALCCFVAVAISGIQQAWLRLGGLDGLSTAYSVLVLAKVAALVALGSFGWQQRRNLTERLSVDPADGRAFGRLAGNEVMVMGLAVGVAVALARSLPPTPDSVPNPSQTLAITGYPDPGPMRGADWLLAWRPNWLLLAIAVLMVTLYAVGVRRLQARGDRWPVGRTICWVLGWLVFVWATSGAPDIWGRVMFSVHMVMHMTIAMFVPLLLVPAAPITLALRALPARTDKTWGPREVILQVVHSRAMAVLSNPVVAALLFFASLALFYFWEPGPPLTGPFELALTTHTGHLLMLAHFFLTGYLFTWVLIGIDPGPRRWPPMLLLVVLFVTVSFHAFFGVILTSSQTLLAPNFFQALKLPWLTDPFADQVTAGQIAWGVGEFPTLILALLVARQWFSTDRATAERLDRQADRDGDAELEAYNAMLAERKAASERSNRREQG